jgi:hypothetical protein
MPYDANSQGPDDVHERGFVFFRGSDVLMLGTTAGRGPMYLREPFISNSHFKRQADDLGWKPSECSSRW